MRKVMIVAVVLITQALFAQEIDVQELFKKIEERNSALKNLKVQGVTIFDDGISNKILMITNVVGTVTYLKDVFLSFEVLLTAPVEGSVIINYVYLKNEWACKLTSNTSSLKISLAAKGQEDTRYINLLSTFAHLTLLDLNLAPLMVFRGKQMQVKKVEKNGKEYALLRYTITFPEQREITCYLNLKELLFEEVIVSNPRTPKDDPIIWANVEEFNNINNVLLPQTVVIGERSCPVAKIIFKPFMANLEKIDLPYWLTDKNLPYISKETSDELKSKIEKYPQNTELIFQYLANKLLEIDISKFPDKFQEEASLVQSKLKGTVMDSVLVNEMKLISLIGEEKLEKCEEEFKRTNYNSPHAICLFALKLCEKGKDPSQLLEKVKQEGIIKDVIFTKYKISQIKTFKDIQDILDGKTFEEKLVLCNSIEPSLKIKEMPFVIKSVLSEKLIEEMEKQSEDEFIKLLLARYFMRMEEIDKAFDYYAHLSNWGFFYFTGWEIGYFFSKGISLANQYAKSEQYEKALKLYRNILLSPFRPIYHSFSQQFDEFNTNWDVIVKFAFVARKLNDKSAIEEIAKYEERSRNDDGISIDIIIQAYEAAGEYDIAFRKYKKYIIDSLKSPHLPDLTGWHLERFLNYAKKTGRTLQANIMCDIILEVFLDKLSKYEPEDEWDIRRVKYIIETATKEKETLGITQQHFIEYVLKQPYKDIEQDIKEKVKILIKQLDSDDMKEREQTTQELIKLGKKIVPLLKEHLNSPSLEVQLRVKDILYKIGYDELKQQILQENK